MSEPLEPEDDTLIWSAWVFLTGVSTDVLNLQMQFELSTSEHFNTYSFHSTDSKSYKQNLKSGYYDFPNFVSHL